MVTRKIDRKTLKQDSFVEKTGVVVDFLQEHYVKFGIVLLVIAVVAVGLTYYRQSNERSTQHASFLLYQGEDFLAKGSLNSARAALTECVERFGGTEFGKLARLSLAKTIMSMGENDLAVATVDESIGVVGQETKLYSDLLMIKAAALSNLEQHADAAGMYRTILARDLPDPVRFDASMRLADNLRLGGDAAAGLSVLEGLREQIDAGELNLINRNLTVKIEMFRALVHM